MFPPQTSATINKLPHVPCRIQGGGVLLHSLKVNVTGRSAHSVNACIVRPRRRLFYQGVVGVAPSVRGKPRGLSRGDYPRARAVPSAQSIPGEYTRTARRLHSCGHLIRGRCPSGTRSYVALPFLMQNLVTAIVWLSCCRSTFVNGELFVPPRSRQCQL